MPPAQLWPRLDCVRSVLRGLHLAAPEPRFATISDFTAFMFRRDNFTECETWVRLPTHSTRWEFVDVGSALVVNQTAVVSVSQSVDAAPADVLLRCQSLATVANAMLEPPALNKFLGCVVLWPLVGTAQHDQLCGESSQNMQRHDSSALPVSFRCNDLIWTRSFLDLCRMNLGFWGPLTNL